MIVVTQQGPCEYEDRIHVGIGLLNILWLNVMFKLEKGLINTCFLIKDWLIPLS